MPVTTDQEKDFYRKLEKLLTEWEVIVEILAKEGSALHSEFLALVDQDKMRQVLARLKKIEE